jgi:hypothetical protein
MYAQVSLLRTGFCVLVLLTGLAVAQSVVAQEPQGPQNFRANYDALLANFERMSAARGDIASQQAARQGRKVLGTLTDDQLTRLFKQGSIPDVSVAVLATRHLASRMESKQKSTLLSVERQGNITLAIQPQSPGFPGPDPVVAGCNGVDITPSTRYDLFIAKEVANAILAAAAWACNEDILGENGSAACIPLAIAADVANGFYDAATFCSGEVTANEVDANFNRLDHIHNDLAAGITTIVNNDDANRTAIENNDNTNTATIVTNDNTNTTTIVTNDNANTALIINNANANKNELRDLILRTQIEADLAMADSAVVVALYETPNANGGYLDLVKTIVTETLANVQAAGGSIGNAQGFLNSANAANAAGNFKTAYALYRKAYKAAGN